MRLRGRTAAAVVGVRALTAALAGLSGPAVAGAVAGSAAPQATVTVRPGAQHVGHSSAQPPTTADCEAAFQVACYEPTQIQQAYTSPLSTPRE